jgi:hypothetical protein
MKKPGHLRPGFAMGQRISHAWACQIWFAKGDRQNIVPPMSSVQEIKAAIGQLPLEERAALISELCGWTDDDWDRRMKADAKAGKFASLNKEAAKA